MNQALRELSGEFQAGYSREGRPSIPPEKLRRALLLQILSTIRSARLPMEQLDYHLRFRCLIGLSKDDRVWDHPVFSKNQERFLDSDLAAAFFARLLKQAAAAFLAEWLARAPSTGPPLPLRFSRTLARHRRGLLA